MDVRYSEPPLTSALFSKAVRMGIPLGGTFELSPICNFNCKMCYVRKTKEEIQASNSKTLTKDEWLSIAKKAKDMGMLYLLLTGGEPLIYPGFWDLYIELVKMGILVSINTNGSLIDEKAVEIFKKYPPNKINITLYGASDDTYYSLCGIKNVYSKVDRAITLLKEAHIQVKLNGTLTPQNISDLEACILYARDKKLIYEANTYMFPALRRDDSMVGKNDRFTPYEAAYYNGLVVKLQQGEEAYIERMKSIVEGSIPPPGLDDNCVDPKDGTIRCRAGKATWWITWDGKLTPCGMMPLPAIDVTEKGFEDSWKELMGLTRQIITSGVCVKCKNQKLCHCCAAMAITETGKHDGIPEYLCEMVAEMKKIAQDELEKVNNKI